jgi:paraquat-inducible protein B
LSAPVDRWKLGLFVVAGIGLIMAALTWLGMLRLQRPTHAAYAYFDEPLPGLEPGSSVKFRGVPIGVVADITLAEDKKHMQVVASLYDDRLTRLGLDPQQLGPDSEFPAGLRAQIVTSYLTQTSYLLVDFVETEPGGAQKLPFAVPKNTILTVRSTFRTLEGGLRDILHDVPEITKAARELLQQARSDLVAAKLPELAARAEQTLAAIEDKVRNLERIAVVQSADRAFREVSELAATWRDENGPVRGVQRDVQALVQQLRQVVTDADLAATSHSLQRAGDGAARAGDEVGALARDLRGELQHLRAALGAVERFADLLERDPGALLHGRSTAESPLNKE